MVAARIQLRDCGATGAATIPARIADSSHGVFTSLWMLVRCEWILLHEHLGRSNDSLMVDR